MIKRVLSFWRAWFAYGLTLGIFVFVVSVVSEPHGRTIPFLIAPVLVTIFQPFLLSSEDWYTGSVLTPALTYPLFLFMLFLLLWMIVPLASVQPVLRTGLFLCTYALLLTGVAILVLGTGTRPFTAQWTATLLGLLLIGSFVYMSPIIDRYYSNAPLRKTLIYLSTQANPILAIGGRIFEKDLLRGPILYKHLSIGRYYSYPSPNWRVLSRLYFLTGGVAGALGVYLFRSKPGDEIS